MGRLPIESLQAAKAVSPSRKVVMPMNVVALEPYYGGSHKAVLDGLVKHTDCAWRLLTMPARKWKWRMRGAAISFARQLNGELQSGELDSSSIDLFFASTFLNVAEFKGLLDPAFSHIPVITYFHENQLVYPVRFEAEWDMHFALTNITTALASDGCLFNSAYNLESFLSQITELFKKFPDEIPVGVEDAIRQKSTIVQPPFDSEICACTPVRSARCRIIWPHRWEHDKNPEQFVQALQALVDLDLDFEVAICGQSHQDSRHLNETMANVLGDRLIHCATPETHDEYCKLLASSDIAVSTADNEFFGLAMVEAAYCGCFVLAPKRLAYPELYPDNHLYESTADLVTMLSDCIRNRPEPNQLREWASGFTFQALAPRYDLIFSSYSKRL